MTGEPNWPRAVVFDLDGTLIDSAPDITHALNTATGARGLAPFSSAEVKDMVGGGVPTLVQRALVARGLAPTHIQPVVEDFIAAYRENLTTHTEIYPGARELLERLVAEGRKLGLCTNKHHAATLAILEQLDLAKYFGAVIGERDGFKRKPDAEPLLEVLAALDVSPCCAVMVGDSEADVGCAKAAGVRSVVVTFGYSRIAPGLLGGDALIASLGELPQALDGLRRDA
ncbi:phosphoglycolate phosphatase [Rhodomicrobium sp. Az07]|uniref:phosphoglycolate phosphatase n=1 Tax=Rhodomicrobium sp. Az07 TaxID=2839034 RepID=UPI001BE9486A|nr:phosphoglycolate phosphatase [Rhodomicrobium sp. Az07]